MISKIKPLHPKIDMADYIQIARSVILWTALIVASPAIAAVTSIEPTTWNIIGLDSNNPSAGPNRFPVGAKVCSDAAGTVPVTFTWDSANAYVDLRSGSLNPINLTFSGAGCKDAFFEVEVSPTSLAFDTTRRYHISAGSLSTPTPREVYVERLVSQGRNAITNMEYGTSLASMQSVAAGGSMTLIKDNTYYIRMSSYTATQGYSQLENFVNFSNTIFQILSVTSTFTSDTSPNPNVYSGDSYLYQDACYWDNDPNSPTYRSCVGGSYNAGGTMTVTYQVKIISVGSGSQTLNSLVHDFSGSSFHYNSDYSTTARTAYLIDPTSLTISKSFSPNPTNAGGVSTLTFTINNPNAGSVSGVNFTDDFPVTPGNMTVASPTGAATSGCGTPTFNPVAGATSISFSSGTVAGNSNCVAQVNVTADTASGTPYTNTTNHLYVDTLDTTKTATAQLTVNTTPVPPAPPAACAAPVTLATWTMDNGIDGSGFPLYNGTLATWISSATSSYANAAGVGAQAIDTTTGNPLNSWRATDGWSNTATGFPNSAAPYFQLDIGISNSSYNGLRISFDYMLADNQGWGGTNSMYIYSSSGGAYTNIYSAGATKNSWQNNIAVANAAATGATTSFRINATASNGTKTSDSLYLDNIIVKGCPRVNPPSSITKIFQTDPVAVGGMSTLRFTVSNTDPVNVAQSYALSGIAFTDTLPSGLTVTSGSSAQCGGTLTTTAPSTISFTGGTLAANATCNIDVTVTAATAGPHTNVSGFVTSTEGGTNTTSVATATLTAILPPVISKNFAQDPILANGVSSLIFTISNPNQNNQLTGVAFSDTFPVAPGAMTVSSPVSSAATLTFAAGTKTITRSAGSFVTDNYAVGNTISINSATNPGPFTIQSVTATVLTVNETVVNEGPSALTIYKYSTSGCGTPTYAPVAGAGSISFTNGTIAAGGNCFVTVNVTAPTTGTYTNTSGTVSATTAGNGNTVSDTLTVTGAHPMVDILKQVSTNVGGPWTTYIQVTTGTNVYYQFTVDNPGDVDLSNVEVYDAAFGSPVAGCSWATLAKYTTATCTAGPVSASGGYHQNLAYVYAQYPSGTWIGGIAPPSTSAPYSVAAYATVGLSITKTASKLYKSDGVTLIANNPTFFTAAGDILQYSYVVKNTGYAPLLGPMTVSDNKTTVTCPAVSTDVLQSDGVTSGDGDNYLDGNIDPAKAEQLTCTASYTVTAADVTAKSVTNTASASIGGVSSGNTSLTTYLAPDLTATKTNDAGGTVNLNGSFIWTLTVTNSASSGMAASFSDTQALLQDDLPTSGATYSAGTVSLAGGSTGTINCAIASNTLTCTASGTVSIPIGGSFSVPITVTATAGGSLANPRSGGICRADPNSVKVEINDESLGTDNNSCSNTVTVTAPSLVVLKSVLVSSDPVNGASNPKAIPGAVMTYMVQVTNTGDGTADSGTIAITDAVPANMTMCVSAACSNPPVVFSCSAAPACGLTYTYATDVTYSNAVGGGAPYAYTPVPDANGYDSAVTGMRVVPNGVLGVSGGSFSIYMKMKIQ